MSRENLQHLSQLYRPEICSQGHYFLLKQANVIIYAVWLQRPCFHQTLCLVFADKYD